MMFHSRTWVTKLPTALVVMGADVVGVDSGVEEVAVADQATGRLHPQVQVMLQRVHPPVPRMPEGLVRTTEVGEEVSIGASILMRDRTRSRV